MSFEVKTFNNQTVEPGYVVSEVKKVDEDHDMGLDYDENKTIKLVCMPMIYETKDNNLVSRVVNTGIEYVLPYNYLLVSDLWAAALKSDDSVSELNVHMDDTTLKHIVDYLNIRKGVEIRIGYSHLAKMNTEEKEAEKKRLSTEKISYKCKSAEMSVNLPDNKEEVAFIDQFTAEEGGPALKALLEAANYLGMHSLVALCAIKIRSFSIGVRTVDLEDRMEKIFHTGKYAASDKTNNSV